MHDNFLRWPSSSTVLDAATRLNRHEGYHLPENSFGWHRGETDDGIPYYYAYCRLSKKPVKIGRNGEVLPGVRW